MQLFVRNTFGQSVVVEASTVAEIRAAIAMPAGASLVFAGQHLEGSLAQYHVTENSTVEVLLPVDGGKKKKKKRKPHKGPKKPTHRHKNVPMRVLKFYKVEGNGNDEDYKVTRLRMECPHPDCGAGVFMGQHKDRQHCGKCSLTYVKK